MEPIQLVLHPHVEGRRDRAFLDVAPDVQVAVGSPVGQPVDEPGVSVEAEDDVLVFREQRVVVGLAEAVWVLARRLQLHQIHDVDHPDLQVGQVFAQD